MNMIEPPVGAGETQLGPLPVYFDVRAVFANSFLSGRGLEIGPLHQPLAVPAHADVRYVDRMSSPDLRHEYPELVDWDLTDVDIVDDGEKLASIPAGSQDFIIANHFLEHTENPVGTIETHLGKLKPGGVLFYTVPDKRFTFDVQRPVTPIEHMIADYEEGPERSRTEHYREWCRLVINEESPSVGTAEQAASEEWVEERARQLEDQAYSIHMHVWTEHEFMQLILTLRERFGGVFDVEAAARVGIEFVVVLRKRGSLPAPPPPATPTSAAAPAAASARAKDFTKRAAAKVRREIRQRRAKP